MKADIHSFESLAALDGDGLRYAVFFTGCPLRCICCHNPDTWHLSGREIESRQLYEKIRRYKPYFRNGGGVTFSGGEPLLHAAYINEVNEFLKTDGINYAIDTSGSADLTDSVKTAIDGASLIILDIKYPDRETYEKYTHGDFGRFCRFAEYLSDTKKRVWFRTVIIPGINDSEKMIERYAEFISKWERPEKYELLAFHTMGFYKYEEEGLENPLKDTEPMDKKRLSELQKKLNELIFQN